MFGYILQNIERMINRRVLLPDWTFEFKYKDPSQQQLQSQIDLTSAQAVTALQAGGTLSANEARQYLANTSENFKDVLTNEKGEVVAADAAVGGPSPDVSVEDSNNVSLAPQAPAVQPAMAPAPKPVVPGAPVAKPTVPQAPIKPQPKPAVQGAIQKAYDPDQPRDEYGRWGGNISVGPHSMVDNLKVESAENRIYIADRDVSLSETPEQRRDAQRRLDHAQHMHEALVQRIHEKEQNVKLAQQKETEILNKIQETDLRRQQLIKKRITTSPEGRKVIDAEIEHHKTELHRLGQEFDANEAFMRANKAFSVTSANFERQFVGAFSRALGGRMPRSQFEGLMLGFLSSEGAKSYADGLRAGGGDGVLSDDDQERVQNWLVDQIDYIDGLADELYNQGADPGIVHDRAEMWVNKSLGEMYEAGRLAANPNGMYLFDGDDGYESCEDCQRLKGQVHTLKAWHDNEAVPKIYTDSFKCGGYKCQHKLTPTTLPESGGF